MGRVFIPGFRKIETSGGGEGGTTNYNDLKNKPSINNVPLVGNLRTVDLKLTDATLTEEGVPAEAKTVGAKLEEHSTSLLTLKEQLGNHTVKSDVPENAVFTDTVYDDTEVKESIDELNSNLDGLEYSEIAGGKNLFNGIFIADYVLEAGIYYTEKDLMKSDVNLTKDIAGKTFCTIGCYLKKGTYTLSYTNNAWFSFNRVAFAGTKSESIAYSVRNSYTWTQNVDGYTYFSIEGDDSETGDTDTPFSITPNIQIEEGTQATPYEPYIPSVKMLADEVTVQNEAVTKVNASLDDYGLEAIPTNLEIGAINDSGELVYSNSNARDKEFRSCNANDNITVISQTNCYWIGIACYKEDGTFLTLVKTANGNYTKAILTTPTNTAKYKVVLSFFSSMTPSQVGRVVSYVNNSIDEIKNDLDKLNSLPIGSIIQIEAAKDNIETTTQKYGWQYLGTSNIEYESGSANILVTNVYRKNN